MARDYPERVFTSLHHLIDRDWMLEAYRRTRKDGAPGIDGQTAKAYEENLGKNLDSLTDRIRSGRYFAPPVRRCYIPKPDGSQRPLGIPTLEDKVAQRAVLMLLEPIYDADFLSCSHGFRSARSAHDALDVIDKAIMRGKQRWVIDADISKYFDSIPHALLRQFLDKRIRDSVIRRMIDKWLKAGVLEAGSVHRSDIGTPQGGVISPLLSNIFLHYVLDEWFEAVAKPRLYGKGTLVRYADDFVMLFERRRDGERILNVLGKRLGRFGLRLHPDKTRFVDFQARLAPHRLPDGSFTFLGFTHAWVRSQRGYPVLRQMTAKASLARSLHKVADWCKTHRHDPLPVQRDRLARVIRGHCAYFGRTGNSANLARFRNLLIRIWRKWLSRRTRGPRMNWDTMTAILQKHPLPPVKAVRSVLVTKRTLPARNRMH